MRPLIFLAGAVFLCLVSLCAHADPSAWALDKSQSELTVSFSQGGQSVTGHFDDFDAVIKFDPKDLAANSARVTILTGSLSTGNKDRDVLAKGADWFDTGRFPEARFETTSWTLRPDGQYDVAGNLTLRAMMKPFVVPMDIKMDGDRAVASGSLVIRRTDFGVGQGAWSTDAVVGFDIKIDVKLIANRASTP